MPIPPLHRHERIAERNDNPNALQGQPAHSPTQSEATRRGKPIDRRFAMQGQKRKKRLFQSNNV